MKVLHRYKTAIALVGILVIAAFLRLYRIADYMTFLGDEGRDALVVRGILEGNLVFLGPRASAGDFFLGPIYYYMMAPFLWLFGYDPVGPAVMVAILGIATVFLVYYIGKDLFNEKAGLIAAALYAVSPLVIIYSRSSWNPNPVPFFTILLMYLLYKAVKNNSLLLYLSSGIILGILLQLHYIIVFLGVIAALFLLIGNVFAEKTKVLSEYLLRVGKAGIITGIGFLIGFSPFLAFEVKNNFPNFRTIFTFVTANTVGQETTGAPFMVIVSETLTRVFGRLLVVYPRTEMVSSTDPFSMMLWNVAIFLLITGSLIALVKNNNRLIILLFSLWFGLGVVLFGFYKKPIYDYYFGFLYPVPFLLVGNLLSGFMSAKQLPFLGRFLALLTFGILLILNLVNAPIKDEPNRQMNQMRSIAEFVLSKTDGKPFNFALITNGNSDHAYRYFYVYHDREPVTIENETVDPNRLTVTDQLLIICESVPCSPLGHPLFEVAAFGRGEIIGEWSLIFEQGELKVVPNKGVYPFVKVYKLKHYEGEE